jgi:hypothetical protein
MVLLRPIFLPADWDPEFSVTIRTGRNTGVFEAVIVVFIVVNVLRFLARLNDSKVRVAPRVA